MEKYKYENKEGEQVEKRSITLFFTEKQNLMAMSLGYKDAKEYFEGKIDNIHLYLQDEFDGIAEYPDLVENKDAFNKLKAKEVVK